MEVHTKEELFALGKELGLTEGKNGSLVALLRAYGIHGKFDDSLWDKYIEILENYKKCFCEICGKKLVVDPEFVFDKDHLRCPEDKGHSIVHYVTDLVQKLTGLDRVEALARVEGKDCKHGKKLAYCPPCLEVEKAVKIQMIMAESNPPNYGYSENEI